jgi:CRISPR-associated endonuclease Csn1
VRTYELKGNKFNVGEKGNKKSKYVEAAKGTNLFFAIYSDEVGKRSYETIPLNIVIERQKQGWGSVPSDNGKEGRLLFHLSPNDLVYVPNEEERDNAGLIDFNNLSKEQVNRIYKIVSFTGNRLYAIHINVATTIVNKVEFAQLNKIEFTVEKESCIKLQVNRLGSISTV